MSNSIIIVIVASIHINSEVEVLTEEFKIHDVPLLSEHYGQSARVLLNNSVLPTKRLPDGWVSYVVSASGAWGQSS